MPNLSVTGSWNATEALASPLNHGSNEIGQQRLSHARNEAHEVIGQAVARESRKGIHPQASDMELLHRRTRTEVTNKLGGTDSRCRYMQH
jgi:hypothetical protein